MWLSLPYCSLIYRRSNQISRQVTRTRRRRRSLALPLVVFVVLYSVTIRHVPCHPPANCPLCIQSQAHHRSCNSPRRIALSLVSINFLLLAFSGLNIALNEEGFPRAESLLCIAQSQSASAAFLMTYSHGTSLCALSFISGQAARNLIRLLNVTPHRYIRTSRESPGKDTRLSGFRGTRKTRS